MAEFRGRREMLGNEKKTKNILCDLGSLTNLDFNTLASCFIFRFYIF